MRGTNADDAPGWEVGQGRFRLRRRNSKREGELMGGDNLLKHFFGGFVRLHLLHHAVEGPICGIEMIEELARHGYKLSPGTLYPILHNLADAGYLTCQDEVLAGKLRRNYRATKKGEKLLQESRAKLRELFREVVGKAPVDSQSPSTRVD
jgi:PadR family transcriptional regulator PadR